MGPHKPLLAQPLQKEIADERTLERYETTLDRVSGENTPKKDSEATLGYTDTSINEINKRMSSYTNNQRSSQSP